MSPAESWLRERVAGAPGPLLDAMVAALPADPAPVPEALAVAALSVYRRLGAGTGGREDALPLLAADALFTHAFQAQAEVDPGSLPAMATRWEAALAELAA